MIRVFVAGNTVATVPQVRPPSHRVTYRSATDASPPSITADPDGRASLAGRCQALDRAPSRRSPLSHRLHPFRLLTLAVRHGRHHRPPAGHQVQDSCHARSHARDPGALARRLLRRARLGQDGVRLGRVRVPPLPLDRAILPLTEATLHRTVRSPSRRRSAVGSRSRRPRLTSASSSMRSRPSDLLPSLPSSLLCPVLSPYIPHMRQSRSPPPSLYRFMPPSLSMDLFLSLSCPSRRFACTIMGSRSCLTEASKHKVRDRAAREERDQAGRLRKQQGEAAHR